MLQQILNHTPHYVWAILAFLVYRGLAASRARVLGLRAAFVMPALMLALGLHSVAANFGLLSLAGAAWLAGLAAGAALAWRGAGVHALALDRAARTVRVRGSWAPLVLMLLVFAGKFAFAVALAVQPSLGGQLAFALPACAAFGALAGGFMGVPLRLLAALCAAPASAAQAAV